MIDVSVVICTWNRSGLLRQTLKSLEECRIPNNLSWEVLVVDNASSDDTQQVLMDAKQRLPLVTCIEKTPGKSNALNLSLKMAQGKYLLYTDDDVVVDPDWIVNTVSAFQRYNADIVYGRVRPFWETRQPTWFSDLFNGHFALLNHGDVEFETKDQQLCGFGVNNSFQKTSLLSLGGFRTDIGPRHNKGAGGEDTDIFLRAYAKGMKVIYTPHALINHFIPIERCQRRYFRKRTWRGSEDVYRVYVDEKLARCFLGIPRYRFRMAISDLLMNIRANLAGESSKAFYTELRLLNFAGMVYHSILGFGNRCKRSYYNCKVTERC